MAISIVKEQFLQALEFPRLLIRKNVDLRDCRFNGHYVGELGCRLCDAAIECKWLTHHDEFSGLASKPLDEIAAAVDFAMHFVEALVMESQHPVDACTCEACAWLRATRRALAEFENRA